MTKTSATIYWIMLSLMAFSLIVLFSSCARVDMRLATYEAGSLTAEYTQSGGTLSLIGEQRLAYCRASDGATTVTVERGKSTLKDLGLAAIGAAAGLVAAP